MIDDFLIQRTKEFHKNDFVIITDFMMKLKMGKKIHLCEFETDSLADDLNNLFEKTVDIPRINRGKRQTFDSLIGEEALILAKYLRSERDKWTPRLPKI
jgi:hypothetical protein